MRQHNSTFSSNAVLLDCITNDGASCVNTARNSLKVGASHTAHSCTFHSISSSFPSGGVFYLSDANPSSTTSLSVFDCVFSECNTTGSSSGGYGGGAIYTGCGTLSVTDSSFVYSSSSCFGGAVLAQNNCSSSTISHCTFLSCCAIYGGGLMTFYGPTSSVISSHFISCRASYSGGGLYHDSNITSSYINLSDSLFTDNSAHYNNRSDDYMYRGGGAFEDYIFRSYTSEYIFSFFVDNKAPCGVGNDISVIGTTLSTSHIKSCFTTALVNSFWNSTSHSVNWLPQTQLMQTL